MLKNNNDENINIIKEKYHNSSDISFRKIKIKNNLFNLVYIQSLTSEDKINKYILENITTLDKLDKHIENIVASSSIKNITDFKTLFECLENGFTIIFVNNYNIALGVETKSDLKRSISEPITEQTISGPKDSFTENYISNIGLIRKRIKDNNLVLEEYLIGEKTKTKTGILYLSDIIETSLLNEVRKKIKEINIDGILDASYISGLINTNNNVFPLIETTERPDLACMSLLSGKICIVCDNSPYALIIPTFLKDLFVSPEDNYQKNKNVTFTKSIRVIAFFIAIILPAFYLAITTYNHETIPISLIVNFAAQRDGVPFPAIVEALGMTLIFEILRESDIRMPSLSGSAISILGAIVLGDAAVTAGIVSPIMVIVIAMSAICNLMFSHVSMVNAIRIWRIIFMLFATILGLPGIFFGIFLFIINVSSLKSFGKPYLYPLAPINIKNLKNTVFKPSVKNNKTKNPLLTK